MMFLWFLIWVENFFFEKFQTENLENFEHLQIVNMSLRKCQQRFLIKIDIRKIILKIDNF